MSPIILFKVVAAPLLIFGLTLLIRRFGPVAGGLAMGLPLITGPISVVASLEQGPEFSSHAAVSNLVGQVSTCLFCFAYARTATRFPAWLSAICGIMTFVVATLAWNLVVWNLLHAAMLLTGSIVLLAWATPKLPSGNVVRLAPWWDLPVRMVVASCFVLAITSLTAHLGAQLSGLISPFPVFVLILAIFTHLHHGGVAASRMMRGVILGSPAFGAFFLVTAMGLNRLPIAVAYACATIVCVIIGGSVHLLLQRPPMWHTLDPQGTKKTVANDSNY